MAFTGASLEETQSRLVDIGLDQQAATAVANEVFTRVAYERAAELISSGASPAETQGKLVEYDFDQQIASEAVC